MSPSSHLHAFARFHPSTGAWPVAVRATISVLIPLFVLYATGHLDWAMYAAFGTMASLFGRAETLRGRLRMQLESGVSLVVAIMLGVCIGLSPEREWIAIPAIAIFATVLAVVVHRRNWHPGGVIFQVFAIGAVSSAPHTTSDFLPAVSVSCAALLLVLMLTTVASALGSLWRVTVTRTPRVPQPLRPQQPPQSHLPQPTREAGAVWPWHNYVIRYGVGIAVAGLLATFLGIGHPYWAMVSVTVPLAAATSSGRTLRGVQRVFGTLGGVLVTWAVLSFDPSPIALIIVVGLAQAGAEIFIGRNYAFALLFITPLALCMVQLSHPISVTQLITDRAVETVLGVAVGLAITLLTHERKQGTVSST